MKKLAMILVLCLIFSGCGRAAWETVSDQILDVPREPAKLVHIAIPSGAAQTVLAGDDGEAVYFCDGYTICLANRESGDLNATLKWLTGLSREQLTLVERKEADCIRYDCAWTAAGENGQQVCRAEILDDGAYHYTVSVISEDENTEEFREAWEEIFQSFGLGAYKEATS